MKSISNKKVLIFGAGSIGTHHANAARQLNCEVTICDINNSKFDYMRENLYPSRYNKWDNAIKFRLLKDIFKNKVKYDLIVIGIPPSKHLDLLKKCCLYLNFKKILIEKPLCVYSQKYDFIKNLACKDKLYCGFNHSVSKSITFFLDKIRKNVIGEIKSIEINWKEDFNLILKAHPWIKNLNDCYLSNISDGGGGAHEYSHAIHMALVLKNFIFKKPLSMTYDLTYKKLNKKQYDSETIISFYNKLQRLNLTINTLSNPCQKNIKITGSKGKLYWNRKIEKGYESVCIKKQSINEYKFDITRPDDFITQMRYLLSEKKSNSNLFNIKIESAIEVMDILKKIFTNA